MRCTHRIRPPPEIYLERVSYITDPDRQNYAAMVVALDDGVGQVLATLQANNLLENTLVFFLSDNGAPSDAATDGEISNNAPLRGYKYECIRRGYSRAFRCPVDRTTAGEHCL